MTDIEQELRSLRRRLRNTQLVLIFILIALVGMAIREGNYSTAIVLTAAGFWLYVEVTR